VGALGIPGLDGGRLVLRDKYTGSDDHVHVSIETWTGAELAHVIVPISELARAARFAQALPDWETINVNLSRWPQ
jgi:hypothetical protein